MTSELLLKLKDYLDLDEDTLQNFLNGIGGENDEYVSNEMSDWELENLNSELVDSMEFIGQGLSKIAPELRDKSKEMASKLILKFVQGNFHGSHPLPIYQSVPEKNTNAIFDLDLERTLEDIIENPMPSDRNLWVFQRKKVSNPVVLLLDTSYSMSGVKLIMAGLTVGILAQLVSSRDLCIVGFHKSVYMIKRFEEYLTPYNLINRIMNIIPRGGTNLSSALEKGGELIFSDYRTAKLIMLSDAEPTVGKNPLTAASKLPKLDLLLFPAGNQWLGNKLVLETKNGKLHYLRTIDDVIDILKKIFTSH